MDSDSLACNHHASLIRNPCWALKEPHPTPPLSSLLKSANARLMFWFCKTHTKGLSRTGNVISRSHAFYTGEGDGWGCDVKISCEDVHVIPT